MLIQVDISHLAIIQELHLDLLTGTTIFTGETGAGKSILIDAIELALGNRATAGMVRGDQEKADISLTFDIRQLPAVQSLLKQNDIDYEADECIIRRTIQKDGRSRCYINSIPSTLQLLRELSDLMINIHGQHEHQALFKLDTQRDILDKYAGHQSVAQKVFSLAEECQSLILRMKKLRLNDQERNTRKEYLTFQLTELDALHLLPNELETLDLEHKQLAHAGESLQKINIALNTLSEDENYNVLSLLNHTVNTLETVQGVNPKIAIWVESLKNSSILLSDTHSELQRYLETIELDPERLKWVEERIGTLFDMARKHKVAPQELFALQQKIAAELQELNTSDVHLVELEQALATTKQAYQTQATKLSQSRIKAAKKLSLEITQLIHELALPHGQFHIQLITEDMPAFALHGLEKVVFQIAMNIGQPMQPVAKVASGGELSRISLAIHMATAGQHTIPTLIFDEVDVGIGGGTAEIIGKMLRRLGKTHQVLCVTHLPQVAAQGHQHFLVEKHHEQKATYTQIRPLTQAEKIAELARMLGGVEITKTTMEHAKEMLEHSALQS
jgi:DNA repair protein RecN (Recombination protein N)